MVEATCKAGVYLMTNRKLRSKVSITLTLAMMILFSTVSSWAQGNQEVKTLFGSGAQGQAGIEESPDRQKPPGSDTVRRLRWWNEIMLKANARDHARPLNNLAPEQVGPGRTARAFAIVQIAVFDAVNIIAGRYRGYGAVDVATIGEADSVIRSASLDAAIAQSAHDTLVELYKAQKPFFDLQLALDLSTIPDGFAKKIGIIIGQKTAAAILADRAKDGSQHPEPMIPGDYVPKTGPGFWRPDPVPAVPPSVALGARWREVRPFVLNSSSQFRIAPPPGLTSVEYTKAFDEVFRLGGENSTERTADQTIAGIYWGYDGTPFLGTPPRLYNQITIEIAEQRGTGAVELARLLALINVGMADAGIAAWESKYFYEFWRPVTAIRESDTDGNPNTPDDNNFIPLGAPLSNLRADHNITPPFPAYPSGHATFGSTLFQILRKFYGTDEISFSFVSDEFNGVTRDNFGRPRPRVVRTFKSLSHAEEENGQSRIYLGIHWAFDKTQGMAQGRKIADYVFANAFLPR